MTKKKVKIELMFHFLFQKLFLHLFWKLSIKQSKFSGLFLLLQLPSEQYSLLSFWTSFSLSELVNDGLKELAITLKNKKTLQFLGLMAS